MRKLKKLLAAVLAGTMVITSLTGCGGSGSSSKGPLTIEQIKKNGKLIVATEAAYEPFEYLDKDGETIKARIFIGNLDRKSTRLNSSHRT